MPLNRGAMTPEALPALLANGFGRPDRLVHFILHEYPVAPYPLPQPRGERLLALPRNEPENDVDGPEAVCGVIGCAVKVAQCRSKLHVPCRYKDAVFDGTSLWRSPSNPRLPQASSALAVRPSY